MKEDIAAKAAYELMMKTQGTDKVQEINKFIKKYQEELFAMALSNQDVSKLEAVLDQAHKLKPVFILQAKTAYAADKFRNEIEAKLKDLSPEKMSGLSAMELEAAEQILKKAQLTDLKKQPGSDGRPLEKAIDEKLQAIDTQLHKTQINFADGSHRPARSNS